MLSHQFREYGEPLVPNELPTPVPADSEVLVAVEACGVCHTDLHIHQGAFDLGAGRELDVRAHRALPFTLGHEIAGTVVDSGPDSDTETGASVVVYPWIGCHTCPVCRAEREQLCPKPAQLGINVDGGFSTHVLVPHDRYLIDRGSLSAARAGPLACSVLTAHSALAKAPDGPLLVIGAGGVGLAAIAASANRRPVAVAEPRDGPRDAALALGALVAFDPGSEEGVEAIHDFAKQHGRPRAVVDFVGTQTTVELAFRHLDRSGVVVVVGLFGGELRRPIPYFPLLGHSIVGSNTGSLQELRHVVSLADRGELVAPTASVRPLSEADTALDDLSRGSVTGRVVLAT